MSSTAPQLAIERSADAPLQVGVPNREIQEMWFRLARTPWTSLVLVPADQGGSAAAAAASLADVGRRLRDAPVTFFILANSIDYASAGKITAAVASAGRNGSTQTAAPTGKVIVAIQPVVVEPLGLAVTEAADVVVLCVQLGRTRIAAARRTIELIGRQRIAGALLVP
jgi:hypothetical protein